MQPLAALAAGALAKIQGLACDLDDTLTRHGELPPAALSALHDLRAAGIPVIVATGRPLGWGEVLGRVLPVRAVVTENGGAWIVREGRTARVGYSKSEAERFDGMARVRTAVSEVCARLPLLRPVVDFTIRATDVALDLHEAGDVPDDVVAQATDYLRQRGLYTIRSTIHLHVSAQAADKFAGLRAAVTDVGLDASALTGHWVYVGDSPNDVTCFRAMNLSVGVANVAAFTDTIGSLPRFVTRRSHSEGFAEVAERVLADCVPRRGDER